MKYKFKSTYLIIVFTIINLSIVAAQHKKVVIKGLVNKKVIDTFGAFSEDSIRIGDTVNVEVIYNYLTQKETSNLLGNLKGKYFLKQDSNYFRGTIKNHYFNYTERSGREFLINKLDNTTEFGKQQDRLNVFTRAINLPSKNNTVDWGISRMEIIGIDTTLNAWNNNALPLPDTLDLLINDLGQIHFWGESTRRDSDSKIFNMDIKANIISIQTFDYFPVITSTQSANTSQSFSITPNPSTTGFFHIDGNIEPTQLQVYNAQGNTIIPVINNHTLDLSAYPRGMYVVVATVNGRMVSRKVVIE